jgi:hypothetical protein
MAMEPQLAIRWTSRAAAHVQAGYGDLKANIKKSR